MKYDYETEIDSIKMIKSSNFILNDSWTLL